MAGRQVARHRSWIFTLNNPQSNELPKDWQCSYAIWQRERGDSGTEHLQGYVIFGNPKGLSAIKKNVNSEAHWEPRRGTHAQAKAYASKTETRLAGPWTYGTEPKQGSREDLLEIRRGIEEGKSDLWLIANYYGQWLRYNKSFSLHRLIMRKHAFRPRPEILVVTGPSGIGKTRTVREAFPNAFWKDKGKFWDGYDGEDTIVFDEFFGWYPYDGLKRLLDYGRFSVEVKGATVPMLANKFVFTSNKAPEDWYFKVQDPSNALIRRFAEYGEVLEMSQEGWIWRVVLHPNVDNNRYVPY